MGNTASLKPLHLFSRALMPDRIRAWRMVPDANTIWTFRDGLKRADAVDILFRRFDEALRASGFLAMSGQIIDATIVVVPKQPNGGSIGEAGR